jgi:opacity protein-like surface antigen
MRSKFLLYAVFGALIASASSSFAQSIYAAQERHLPIAVGTGVSSFNLDYGGGRRMDGITAWIDWSPPSLPPILRGVGLEIEGRDLNFARPSSLTKMRQDTFAGGLVYNWPRYRIAQPYFQYLMGMGSIDFPSTNPHYTHDTRAIYAPGGGLEVKAIGNLKVRASYEYQFWLHIFGPHALNPNGFTFGTEYDFRGFGRRPQF